MKTTELTAEKIASKYAAKNNEIIAKFSETVFEFDDINQISYIRLARGLATNILNAIFEIADYSYERELYEAQRRNTLRTYHIDDELIYDLFEGRKIYELVYKNVMAWAQDIALIKDSGKRHDIPRAEIQNLMKMKTGTIGECGLTYQIMRILRTESNNTVGNASIQAYKDAGAPTYTYHSILDNKVCSNCYDLDGRTFLVSEAKQGVNLPSLHPNCRCYITPGGSGEIRNRISFTEWRKQFLK